MDRRLSNETYLVTEAMESLKNSLGLNQTRHFLPSTLFSANPILYNYRPTQTRYKPLPSRKFPTLIRLAAGTPESVIAMADIQSAKEVLPPPLDASSEPPPLFDGTTRLYISYQCPYAQRVWIARNCKGLEDKIKLVPIDLHHRPAWYKEKLYPENKVPSLEHNNKVIGESLDLIKYVDSNFEGPSLLPNDPSKRKFANEFIEYSGTFIKMVLTSFKGDPIKEAGGAFDYLETALHKFDDGPFFLGQFSLADIAYAPFIERFQLFLQEVWKYDITSGRPKLAIWIEEMNKNDAYKPTNCYDPKILVQYYKSLAGQS